MKLLAEPGLDSQGLMGLDWGETVADDFTQEAAEIRTIPLGLL